MSWMRRALQLASLTALWVVLWRDLSVANLVSGVTVAVLVTVLFPLEPTKVGQHTIRPLPLLAFVAYFGWALLVSNLVVARTILSPTNRVRTGILRLPLPGCSDLVTTWVANAITLTPGTMTIEVSESPRVLYIHVLQTNDDLMDDERQSLHKLLHVALRAFYPDETVARIEQDALGQPSQTDS